MSNTPRLSWTQAICDQCWNDTYPGRAPVAIKSQHARSAVCAYCGDETHSGIFVRADPATVSYPQPKED